MKFLFSMTLLLGSFCSFATYACQNGDTSKILLVLADSGEGEENAVIGEVLTGDGSVHITRDWYELSRDDGKVITVKNLSSGTYSFDRANAREAGFCFKAIFGTVN